MKKAFDFTECEANKARIDAYRPLPPETLKSLRDYYRIGLTYTSNAIEGNSLTESETKVVIEDGLTVKGKPLHDIYEAVGHAQAYDHIYELVEDRPLQEEDILTLHRMFYRQIDEKNAGNYRTVQVFISGSHHRLPLAVRVPELMAGFVEWFNTHEKKLSPVEFAALVHQKFVFIHPFVDGNGRLARLLMNLALLRTGYTISIIPPILRGEYIATLERAHEDEAPFVEFIKGRVIETQRELIRLFGEEFCGVVCSWCECSGGRGEEASRGVIRMKKSASSYKPPYTISEKAVTLIAEIAAALERYKIVMEGLDGVRLRKINHVKTIRGTTAIEGNTLTEEQVTAVLAGKRVVAPRREIDEIKGAHAAYELLEKVNPYSLKDMLRVHAVMMAGLVDGAGELRTRGVGVVDGLGNVLHMAPPAEGVPQLVSDLLDWTAASTAHPLVKSCVFHYEFEFIHPFLDGNGRMGRFLQTVMLGKWNELFYAAPVENIIFSNQEKYYQAINDSTAQADCGPFIDFMLERILETIRTKGGG